MTLGERIIRYRAKHNMTQVQFANKAGLSTQTIYLIESELQRPKKITVAKINLLLDEDEGKEDEVQHIAD